MMRWSPLRSRALCALTFSLAIVSPRATMPAVVVNEVYYDHPGRDDGWEFVEILNTGAAIVDLSGWTLELVDGATGRATIVWTAPAGGSLEPGIPAVVAGAERSPAYGWDLRAALGNGPDAVRLRSPAGIVDLVGYGPCAASECYESSPAPDPPAGWSLARKPDGADSDQNDADFVAAAPSPGRRNFHERDLSAGLRLPEAPPCRGGSLALLVRVMNRGLEPFAGIVTARVTAGAGPAGCDTAVMDMAVDLKPGESDSTTVHVAVPPSSIFEAAVSLACGLDENPANDASSAPARASPGEAIVNEIMYRPEEGGPEWIEIHVPGDGCEFAGWTLGDATGARRVIATDSLRVPGGGYLILARDSAAFAARYPRCSAPVRTPAGGWPALNDSGDECADVVFLRDADGVCVERTAYPDLLGAERGRSIERVSIDLCSSAREGLWHRSAASDRATPGAPNASAIECRRAGTRVSIVPNPFAPRGGGVLISGAAAPGETGLRIRVFSLAGIEVRRLFGERGGASLVGCRWDGRDGSGEIVPAGVYVCLVEYLGPGGGVCRREKACIVVAQG